jgi:hypothetical protein
MKISMVKAGTTAMKSHHGLRDIARAEVTMVLGLRSLSMERR